MKNRPILSKIIDFILNVLIIFFGIFLLISMYTLIQVKVLKNEYSNFFGYSLFEVQTGSMHGTIESGDWIIIKLTKDVGVGDIITYRQGDSFVTHRITESYKGTFVTKGDANNTADEPIDSSQVIGKLAKILHGFGILRKSIFNPPVIIFLIIILYAFNLIFKKDKSKFDLKVQDLIKNLKKLANEDKEEKVKKEIKEERVTIIEEEPEEVKEKIVVEELPFKKEEVHEVEETKEKTEEEIEEELSKTVMFRYISLRDSASDEGKSKPRKEKKELKEAIKKEIKETKKNPKIISKSNAVIAEEVLKVKEEKVITRDYIFNKIKRKKTNNVLDKNFVIKNLVIDEILDIVLKPMKAYILKAPLRTNFIDAYFGFKYYGSEEDRINTNALLKELGEKLIKKNIRDEKMINIIHAYVNSFMFISNLEDKKNPDYVSLLKKSFDYDRETIENMAFNIDKVIKYSNEYLTEMLESLESTTFTLNCSKIVNQKKLYGVKLEHNIKFSRVYSNYIVDKTYSEGIISEDKLEVLFNMLLCRIVSDMTSGDFSSKYFVYIPGELYGKEKKFEKILSIIGNDYGKNHIYFVTTISNMFAHKSILKKYRKKGYLFACILNQKMDYVEDDMGYMYMNDYYFVDSNTDITKVSRKLPKEIKNQIIVDNVTKKLGDLGGE